MIPADLNYAALETACWWLLWALVLGAPNSAQGLIALDQWLNTRIGGFADETLSARAYRNRLTKRRWAIAYRVINILFFWQEDHCKAAWQSEIDRLHMPKDYRA